MKYDRLLIITLFVTSCVTALVGFNLFNTMAYNAKIREVHCQELTIKYPDQSSKEFTWYCDEVRK